LADRVRQLLIGQEAFRNKDIERRKSADEAPPLARFLPLQAVDNAGL
jgi:hypothetical protein